MTPVVQGVIYKAMSGFYYVWTEEESSVTCRARGKFRLEKRVPLVGDRVHLEMNADGSGTLMELLPRSNVFIRPPVANLDQLIIIAANVNPITDPYLIDRIMTIAELQSCEPVVCINKCDLDPAAYLYDIYKLAGFQVLRVSAKTGEGMETLRGLLRGKISAFTGNSGVGKSSILNVLQPDLKIATGEVSQKLGRGRHTTRHVELFPLESGGLVADTPGFAALDAEEPWLRKKDLLPQAFREFRPYLGTCRFRDCTHMQEPGCAILSALESGEITTSRYSSYVRMYEQAAQIPDWAEKKRPTHRV